MQPAFKLSTRDKMPKTGVYDLEPRMQPASKLSTRDNAPPPWVERALGRLEKVEHRREALREALARLDAEYEGLYIELDEYAKLETDERLNTPKLSQTMVVVGTPDAWFPPSPPMVTQSHSACAPMELLSDLMMEDSSLVSGEVVIPNRSWAKTALLLVLMAVTIAGAAFVLADFGLLRL
jgi:hypothetical protein